MRKSRFTGAQLIWMIKEQEAGLPTPAASWRSGDTITTTSDPTHHWKTKRPLKRVERLSNLRAPRPTRLLKTKTTNMKTRPADSRYK